jgi:hypothetical protein
VFNDGYLIIEPTPVEDWHEFFPGTKVDLPPNAPKPLGKQVTMVSYCDTDHAGDHLTHCSCTRLLIFLNRSPTFWYSKKQVCTFGSEFMGLKIATDLVKGLWYTFRMMSVPLEGSTHMCVDNMSVANNSTWPESTLKKKRNCFSLC